MAKAELHREVWLAMINSKRPLIAPKTNDRNNKQINLTFRKVFAHAFQFASLPKRGILDIFSNWFRPLNLYNLRQVKYRNYIYQEQIAITDNILQIWRIKGWYWNYSSNQIFKSDAFLSWINLKVEFFKSIVGPLIMLAFSNFYRKSLDLAKVYLWQRKISLIAHNLPINIIERHYLDFSRR